MNIPIYRAKKIDSDEYVEGFYAYQKSNDINYIFDNNSIGIYRITIDPSTLAIHFPDMIDSEGNKIFASLSEDGKGGDILHKTGVGFYTDVDEKGVVILMNANSYIKYNDDKELLSLVIFKSITKVFCSLKAVGIKK